MAFKLLAGAALAAVAFADEPVGTVIGIDLGTTYSVRPYTTVWHPLLPCSEPAARPRCGCRLPSAAARQQRCS